MKKIIKSILTWLILLLFIISLPAVFINSNKLNQAKDNAQEILDILSRICNSTCTDYPVEWVISDKKKEAELYCIEQCSDNMMEIRKEILSDINKTLFSNIYSYRVNQIYCVLGLQCIYLDISDFIYGYKPTKQ